MRLILLLGLAGLFAAPATAAVRLNPGAFQGAAITTSSQVIIGPGSILGNPPGPLSAFLYLENAGGGTICISFDAPATISGTTCAAGEITLTGAGAFRFFDDEVPASTVYAIASAASALTVGAQ